MLDLDAWFLYALFLGGRLQGAKLQEEKLLDASCLMLNQYKIDDH